MTTAKQQCLEDLQSRILRLDLPPGAELDETPIARRYGLSRTPLREVFRTLEGQGYLTLAHNRGARVSPLDAARLKAFFRTAPMLLTSVARLAAETRDAQRLDALREAQQGFLDAVARGEATDAALADHEVQAQIGALADNPYLGPGLTPVLVDLTRLTQSFFEPATKKEKKAVKKAGQQHDALIAAIEAQDAEAAAAAAVARWRIAFDHIKASLHAEPLSADLSPAV